MGRQQLKTFARTATSVFAACRTAAIAALLWSVLQISPVAELASQASSRPCPPVSERTDAPHPACVTGSEGLGRLPDQPMFWHLDSYQSRAAAEAAKGPRGSVIESLGRVWLFTIADARWRPEAGERVATVGPLPVAENTEYTAVYMESIFEPGTTAAIHRHSGPEAFYTLSGETCLETPEGILTGRGEGHALVVPGGPPMLLVAKGAVRRRGVVLILHDSSQPATTMVHDWIPQGLCTSRP